MKKLLFILLLVLSTIQVFYGQDGIGTKNAIPSIVPPTPEAFSIARFGGNQIGLNTGTVVYSISLYSIKVGDFSLPISISYGSNGVKVDEVASRVGMQWKMDFAGVVNRSIIGDPDEQPSWINPTNDTADFRFYHFLDLIGYAQGNGAFQPDQFNFSAPGCSGQFIIDSGGRIVQIPYGNYKITKSLIYSFEITAPDGTNYKFGNGATESTLGTPVGGDNGSCYPETLGQPAITSWYLTGIYLTNGDSIKYVYDVGTVDSTSQCLTGINQTYTFQGGKYGSDVNYHYNEPAIKTCYQMNEYNRVVLKEIRFPSGKVQLFYSSREDVPGEKKMDSLRVLNGDGQTVKRWQFNYRYSYNSSTTFDSQFTGYPSVQSQFPELRKRLFLVGVNDITGSPALPYKFDYNDMDSLPPRLSYCQDYWGYFNGIANQLFFPAYTFGGLFDTNAGVEFGGDRRGNFEKSAKGILKRITYPTGGYTDYTYQPGAVQGYLKWKPAFDTIHLSGMLTNPIEHKDTISLNDGIVKLSITSSAPPLDVDPETELVPDTLIYISIKTLSGTEVFTYNGPVWNSYNTPYLNIVNDGSYVVSVLTNYPPYVNWSMTLYNPLIVDTLPQLPMGGVMVQSLVDNDGMGHSQNRKEFMYGFRSGNPMYFYPPYNYSDQDGMFYSFLHGVTNDENQLVYGLTQIASNSSLSLYINNFSTFPYTFVTEQWIDSTGKVYGGIDHEFLVKKRTPPQIIGRKEIPDFLNEFTTDYVFGAPSSNDDLHNGTELNTDIFKMMDTVKHYTSRTHHVYSVDTSRSTIFSDTLYAVRHAVNRLVRGIGQKYYADFDVNWYVIYSNWMHLDSTIMKSYSDDGDSLTNIQAFEYGDTLHMQARYVTTTNSKGESIRITNKYPDDFGTSPYTDMVSRRMLTAPIEQIQQNVTMNKEIGHIKTNYSAWLGNTFFRPSSIENSIMGTPLQTTVTFNKYDAKANICQYTAKDDIVTAFIWDYNGMYPIAKAVNADSASIAYTSFEADGNGGWTIGSSARDTITAAVTGKKSYSISNGNLSKDGLTSGKVYIVSYWSTNGAKTISGGSGSSRTGRTVGSWTYYEHTITASSSTLTVSGTGSIDEIRLFPAGAQMTTYTYQPLVGVFSIGDSNGEIIYYEYDGFNRLNNTKDYKGSIIKNYQYHYRPISQD